MIMLKSLFLCVLLLFSANMDAQSDLVSSALEAEMQRAVSQLKMKNLEAPYFVRLSVVDQKSVDLKASFGSAHEPQENQGRWVTVDMRVGSREFDNSHFVSDWRYGPITQKLPVDNDSNALRHALWLSLDKAYKTAGETLARKAAFRDSRSILEPLADMSEEKVISKVIPQESLSYDQADYLALTLRLSAVFKDYPLIRDSAVSLSFHEQRYTYLDSEGRRSAWPDNHVILLISAESQSADGMLHQDFRQLRLRRVSDLPKDAELTALAQELATQLTRMAVAPLYQGVYLGPVLLQGQAAGEFMHQMLALNLSAPREPWVANDWARNSYSKGSFAKRLGLRVTAPLLDVKDDPLLQSFEGKALYGTYDIDDEGIPAQPLKLIAKGRMLDLLMSRSPIAERQKSTGHGRAGWASSVFARPSNLIISSSKALSDAALKRELMDQAASFGLEQALLIKRLIPGQELPGTPSWAVMVDVKTGKETLVRGMQFEGMGLRALRDIIATSKASTVYNYDQQSQMGYGGQVPGSIVTPDLLLSEMELKKTDKEPARTPELGHPYFESMR